MIDDIRVRIPLYEPSDVDLHHLSPDHHLPLRRRAKLRDVHDLTLRARSVRKGRYLVIEGSFAGFLQGHAIAGTTDLGALVAEVVPRVLKKVHIRPSTALARDIAAGRVRLERVDIAGFIDCRDFGGISAVIRALDVAFAGSAIHRMIYPEMTLLLDSQSSLSSTSMYHKEKQMLSVHLELWHKLNEKIKDFARHYLRAEKRYMRRLLIDLCCGDVCDFDWPTMKAHFLASLRELFLSGQLPNWNFPIDPSGFDKIDMIAALASKGINVVEGMPESTRNRICAEARARNYAQDLMRPPVNVQFVRPILPLLDAPVRFGAPNGWAEKGLVWTPHSEHQ